MTFVDAAIDNVVGLFQLFIVCYVIYYVVDHLYDGVSLNALVERLIQTVLVLA